MRQAAFTIFTEVRPRQLESLVGLLDEIGDDVRGNPHLRFDDLRDLHHASFAVITAADGTPVLVFEGNIDGRVDPFLHQVVATAGAAVDRIYGHCVGYPSAAARTHPDRAFAYLKAHDIGAHAFYVAVPGWTVEEIRREHHLRSRLEDVLDAEEAKLRTRPPEAIHERLGQVARRDPSLHWARAPHPIPLLVRHGRKVAAGLGTSLALVLVTTLRAAAGRRGPRLTRWGARSLLAGLGGGLAAGAWVLRREEGADAARDRDREPDWATTYAAWSDNLPDIVRREDVQVQNHMVSVTRVKEGRSRLVVLRLVLWVVNLLARLTANRGRLGGIASIHFARWVLTPDRRQLVFLSNFDGSWEQYLTDFIDRAASGLTAVWSNTDNAVGFPAARWLVQGGARDEVRFKAYSRSSMVPTNTWYSAYPDLTVRDIANNMGVRRDLCTTLDRSATLSWLRRF